MLQILPIALAIVIGAPVGMVTAISNSTGIVKKLLKQQEIRRKNNKIVMLARSELNSKESKISEALINNETSHEDFMIIINEDKNIEK